MNRYEIRLHDQEVLAAFSALPDDTAEIYQRFFALDDCQLYQLGPDGAATDVSEMFSEVEFDPEVVYACESDESDDVDGSFKEWLQETLIDAKSGEQWTFLVDSKRITGYIDWIDGEVVKVDEPRFETGLQAAHQPIYLNVCSISGATRAE